MRVGITEESPTDVRSTPLPWADARSFLLGNRAAVAMPQLPDLPMVTQPILDLRTGRIAGYEALARFGDGQPPDQWFAHAHALGRGAELEARAVRAALALPGRPDGTYLSVNAGPTAIGAHQFGAALPPSLEGIVIEVTEHEPFESNPDLVRSLGMLRDRGAAIAVDDAGSGYAGLRQLTSLRPDIIKLDRTLVCGIDSDTVKSAMVYALVEFAHSVGATICAEGIERPDELAALAELGVSHGQGWFIAVPADGWPDASPEASEVCTRSIDAALRSHWTFRVALGRPAPRHHRRGGRRGLDDRRRDRGPRTHQPRPRRRARLPVVDRRRRRRCADPDRHESFDGGRVFPLSTHPLTAHVLSSGDMVQVRSTDPAADGNELAWMTPEGYLGLLMAPIGPRGRPVALLELCARTERPWSHAELYRTRVICQLLSAVVQTLTS